MSKPRRAAEGAHPETQLDLSHVRREVRTALELAVVALAPSDLIEHLAAAAGLLEAIGELPPDSPPVVATIPMLAKRSRTALVEWDEWQKNNLRKAKA